MTALEVDKKAMVRSVHGISEDTKIGASKVAKSL